MHSLSVHSCGSTLRRIGNGWLSNVSLPIAAAVPVAILISIDSVPTKAAAIASIVTFAVAISVVGILRGSRRGAVCVLLFGPAIAFGIVSRVGFSRDYASTTPLVPTEHISGLECVVRNDVFVEESGRYRIDVRIRTVTARCGTVCTGRTQSGVLARLYAPLGEHVYAGEVLSIRGVSPAEHPADQLTLISSTKPARLGFSGIVLRYRAHIYRRILTLRSRLGRDTGALFGALFLGVSGASVDDLRYFVRRAGCIHLLALSGMHVAVLIGLILAALTPIAGTRTARLVAIPIVVCYTALVGMPPALMRACVMYGVASVLSGCKRRYRMIDIVSTSFLLSVALQPFSATTLSLRLTYVAVIGISAGAPACARFLRRWLPDPLAAPTGVSLSAFLATSPFVVHAFGEVYPFGLLATLVIAPLVTFFLAFGAMLVCIEVVWPVRSISFAAGYDLLELCAVLVDRSARIFAYLPAVSVQTLTLVIISSTLWMYLVRRFGRVDPIQLSQGNR